jgi:hypothetical protein
MLRVEFEGKNYTLHFRHTKWQVEDLVKKELINPPPEGTPTFRRTTEICIREDGRCRYRGIAVCSYLDNFSRATGRRLALQECITRSRETDDKISAEFAKMLWATYFLSCKDGKNVLATWLDKKLKQEPEELVAPTTANI